MTPELLDEAVVALAILTGYLLILCVGCLIADYVFPHIPISQRFLDSLPDWDEEEDLTFERRCRAMNDPYWVQWSHWTDQGMVEFGQMPRKKMQENLQRFEVEARKLLAETGADHVLYGRKLYDDDGELDELRFYLFPMTDEEFEKEVVPLNGQQVYAVHKMK